MEICQTSLAPDYCGGLVGPDHSTLLPGVGNSFGVAPAGAKGVAWNLLGTQPVRDASATLPDLAEHPLTPDTPVATVRRDCLEPCAHL